MENTPKRKHKNPAAVALGRRGGLVGGRVKSAAKTAAARANGKLGGRPPKIWVPVLDRKASIREGRPTFGRVLMPKPRAREKARS